MCREGRKIRYSSDKAYSEIHIHVIGRCQWAESPTSSNPMVHGTCPTDWWFRTRLCWDIGLLLLTRCGLSDHLHSMASRTPRTHACRWRIFVQMVHLVRQICHIPSFAHFLLHWWLIFKVSFAERTVILRCEIKRGRFARLTCKPLA